MSTNTPAEEESDRISRRTYLKGTVVSSVGALSLGTGVAQIASGSKAKNRQASAIPQGSLPVLAEFDLNNQYDIEMHLDGDPAVAPGQCVDEDGGREGAEPKSERQGVVHVTSNGTSTQDYASGIADVRDQRVSIGGTSKDMRVAYDYYEGPENERSAPDEVFLVVAKRKLAQGSLDRTGTYVAARSLDDGVDPKPASVSCDDDNKGWRTRNVSAEMRGEVGEWVDLRIGRPFSRGLVRGDAEAILETARTLRDEGTNFESVVDRYGEDAQLLAVGFGAGSTQEPTVVDMYYDQLVVTGDAIGEDEEELNTQTYDFPLAIPMDLQVDPDRVDRDARGTVTMTLDFQQEEQGVSLEDLAHNTVQLNVFEPVAPSLGRGVKPRRVEVTEQGIEVTFPIQRVIDLIERETMGETNQGDVVVSGRFDSDNEQRDVLDFFGVSTIAISEEDQESKSLIEIILEFLFDLLRILNR